MILALLTIVLMVAVGYAYLREGLLTAFTMFCNVFLAGLIAFNFWEPVASLIEPIFPEWPSGEGKPGLPRGRSNLPPGDVRA